jgi:crossover junction endodeoxyribonuclease RuvC
VKTVPATETSAEARVRILGIDPGSTVTGFGVLERAGARVSHIAHGTVRHPRHACLAKRLATLQAALMELIATHRPDVAVIERVFVAASPRAALVLGHARGVALAAVGAAGLPLHEYAPSQIKLAVTGSGAADKRQVQAMVQRLLALAAPPPFDAADALAAALYHGHAGPLAAVWARVAPRARRRRAVRGSRFVVRRK